jgi:hypothetical protein
LRECIYSSFYERDGIAIDLFDYAQGLRAVCRK